MEAVCPSSPPTCHPDSIHPAGSSARKDELLQEVEEHLTEARLVSCGKMWRWLECRSYFSGVEEKLSVAEEEGPVMTSDIVNLFQRLSSPRAGGVGCSSLTTM